MTGYGRSSGEDAGMRIDVELRGVNNRGLDIRLYLPAFLNFAEQACRNAVRAKVSRGRVEGRIRLSVVHREALEVKLSEGTASALSELADSLRQKGTIDRGLTFSDLLSMQDAVHVEIKREAEEDAEKLLLSTLADAMETFTASRTAEGRRIKRQFDESLEEMQKLVGRAETYAGKQIPAIRERLAKKVAALGVEVDEGRIEQEVALAADRSDVKEEQVRLASHLKAMKALLEKDGNALGKRLDHLLQEMQREISTLLAKSDLMELSRVGLEMKLIVEQLREQVLNVA